MALNVDAPAQTPPDILRYDDYREFLRNFYNHKKSLHAGFSYRLFASRAKLKSPNYLQLVIQGKRNLSAAAALNVARALGLDAEQRTYFIALVEVSLAKDGSEFEKAEKLRLRSRSRLVLKQIPSTQREILSRPHHLLVRELCALKDFRFDPRWVSKKLRGTLNEEEAAESLGLLVAGGYLKQSKEGVWVQSDPALDTGHQFDEASVLRYHMEILKSWRRLLEDLPKEHRELGILNVPIDSKKIPEFKRRIRAFQDEIIGWLESESEADTLVQFGTYLIPVTQSPTRILPLAPVPGAQ